MNHSSDVWLWATALILRKLRGHKYLNQKEFMKRSNVSKRYPLYENAYIDIKEDDLQKILIFYQLDIEELIEMIRKECRILKGEEKGEYATKKHNYLKERDEKYGNKDY